VRRRPGIPRRLAIIGQGYEDPALSMLCNVEVSGDRVIAGWGVITAPTPLRDPHRTRPSLPAISEAFLNI
jgi:hypothetical protein